MGAEKKKKHKETEEKLIGVEKIDPLNESPIPRQFGHLKEREKPRQFPVCTTTPSTPEGVQKGVTRWEASLLWGIAQ